jgi:catechol-2,3-dioxygenase
MRIRGFAEVTLQTKDRAGLERFYANLLDLDVLAREDDRTWLSVGPRARLGLWTPGETVFGDEGGANDQFARSVAYEAPDGAGERARADGREVRGPIEHDGGDRSLYITDPEGNVLELWSFFAEGNDVGDL